MADQAQYYEVLVEYKGTKTSGAPMVAAATGWGTSNIFARSALARGVAFVLASRNSCFAGSTPSPAIN
jgi:hypothetical protein